ncbi:hypothetical protein HDU76_001907 [Blyttiomyces sp. JEL0837]|nr:hypothetical protein HDU76_001907 [Blyttiomyces sp. JEL0837]
MEDDIHRKTALQKLIDEPKGKIAYKAGDAFILHVFWEAPSPSTAKQLLEGLRQCAAATLRDTPCCPTYFFRIAQNDADLCPPPPKTVADHPQLSQAIKKLRVGIPRPAVVADLVRRGFDPSFVDLDLTSELPESLQGQQAIRLEFTELYLDERAFMEHAGSRDYLDGYGVVMNPALQNQPPLTIRLGTPPASMIEKILEPMLKENVMPVVEGCTVWQPPKVFNENALAIFLSINFAGNDATTLAASLPTALKTMATLCVTFPHPLRENTVRLMCVVPSIPSSTVLTDLAKLGPFKGEAHVTNGGDEGAKTVRAAFEAAGLKELISVNATDAVGFVLHSRATEVHPE